MPYLDGTGPRGLGPMTGRGMGRCRGLGRGYGYGYGYRWRQLSKEEEIKMLKQDLEEINKRLKELEND